MFLVYFIVMASNINLPLSEDNSSGTDLSILLTEDEERIDTTNWTQAKCKKLQHMTEFHEEYQHVFGKKASIQTIMKNRISHMNPPMPESVCREEMQSVTHDNDVVIEYITDAQGRKIKKLKPLLIKSEPDREYTHHIHSDDDLPRIPENYFTQERETIVSYSETISSESSSEERTLTAKTENTTSSMEDHIEDSSCMKENNATDIENSCMKGNNVIKIETELHQIATSLQHTAKGYLSLASCIHQLEPCELPQMIAQIPPL